MESFFKFIDEKPLYYKNIERERVKIAYKVVNSSISEPEAIHIIGTNGKGSTGRAIAHLAYKSGLKVGHYSSPHILKFNERVWINGSNIDDETLENSHKKLFAILGDDLSFSLSYFEYTTLLAMIAFENLDLIILEAGLGGELDATSVINNRVLSVVTPIDFDHQNFLGDTIKEIATTKLRSISKRALIAPQIHKEVEDIALELSEKIGFELYFADNKRAKIVKDIFKSKGIKYPQFLISNIAVATQALEIIRIEYNIDDLNSLEIFGRFYSISSNVMLDVGHNLLSAKAIFESLDDEVILIYNTLRDKDFRAILSILKPKVKKIEIIDINSDRAVGLDELIKVIEELDIPFEKFDGTLNVSERYLVFGSFYTVEAFLNLYNSFK